LVGVHWTHLALCDGGCTFFPSAGSCETADAISGNSAVASDDLGRETPRLKLTTPKFAETFGKMSTLRTTYSAAIGASRFTIARRGAAEKLHSAAQRVYDNIITSYASPELRTSKSQSC
jgi:hypothetical protein